MLVGDEAVGSARDNSLRITGKRSLNNPRSRKLCLTRVKESGDRTRPMLLEFFGYFAALNAVEIH
jgi:hypothetical protein